MMETFDILAKAWPILLAIITLIIVLSKLDLFDLINHKKSEK